MTDKQLMAKLATLVKICNELDDEAKARYGEQGHLFFEADGSFHVMSGDSNGNASERQEFVEFSSRGYCRLGAGAW